MKEQKPSMEILRQLCGEIRDDDGIDPREFRKEERSRKNSSRDRQLCAQTRRCLDFVLPELLLARGVTCCEVSSVEPVRDASRMSVIISVRLDQLSVAREAISQLRGRLRSEVAKSIHRKRVPDMIFEVVAMKEPNA